MYKAIIMIDEDTRKVEYFETPKYVFRQTNGVIITTDNPKVAQGILCQDNSVIYAFDDRLDNEEYTYTRCVLFEISMNQYIKETADLKAEQDAINDNNAAQLTESQIALCDIYETVDSNSNQITETQTALCDVYEMIATLTESGI